MGQWSTPWPLALALAELGCRTLGPRPLVMDPACGDGRLLLAVARFRPQARLLGLDADPGAVLAARETLARAGLNAEIRQSDALAADAPWPACDLVVANPPWVRPQNLPPARRQGLWSRFQVLTDKADLYAAFVEASLRRARRAALLLPEGWLGLTSFAALRRLLLAFGVDGVHALPGRPFPDVASAAVVLCCDPADRRATGTLMGDRFVEQGTLAIAPEAWSLRGPLPHLPGPPLGEHARIAMGVVCGDYARYVHAGRRHPEDRLTCRGRDVLRWRIAETDEHVRYLPREMLARKPYVAPKRAELFDVPQKVVLAGTTGTVLRAAMDERRRFPLDSCYVLHPVGERAEPWGLLGLLLSSQAQRWYGARHRAARVKAVEVARIPVPPPPWNRIAEAARAADEAGLEAAVAAAYAAL